MCVCVSVHSGTVNQTNLKLLKLRTSNLTRAFPGTVSGYDPLKAIFQKEGVARVT